MFHVFFKNGNMLPIHVHDELTLSVVLTTGSVSYVTTKNSSGKLVRRSGEFLLDHYNLNS